MVFGNSSLLAPNHNNTFCEKIAIFFYFINKVYPPKNVIQQRAQRIIAKATNGYPVVGTLTLTVVRA